MALEAVEEAALEGAQVAEVTVTLCGDERMRELNSEWRGQDSTTDVLSFPQDQLPGLTPVVRRGCRRVVYSIISNKEVQVQQHFMAH